MKKFLVILVVFLFVYPVFSIWVDAEEPTTPIAPTTTITATTEPTTTTTTTTTNTEVLVNDASIVIADVEFGSITCDLKETTSGTYVKLVVAPEFLFEVEFVKVNDIVIEMDEEGYYGFVASEGLNTVTASFVVCNEKVKDLAGILSDAKNGNWNEIFTVNNLLNLISFVITSLCGCGFFVTWYKNKKIKAKTVDEVSTEVKTLLSNMLPQEIASFLSDVLSPSLKTILEKMDSMSTSNEILVHCFILMQENTPESRLAILNQLSKLKHDENELTLKVKNLIEEEIQKREENSQKLEESIEEVKSSNNSIPRL